MNKNNIICEQKTLTESAIGEPLNKFLSLTVEPKLSILHDIKLKEYPNLTKLKLLMNSSLLKNDFNNKAVKYENELKQLTAYFKNLKKDAIHVTYSLSKAMKYGRVFPHKSLGAVGLRREIRQTIFKDNYIDIDVVNAHPVMLLQICKNNSIPCKYLNRYVKKRDALLNDIITTYNTTRDAAKHLFIMLLYFGSFESWANINKIENKEPTEFITKFKNELSMIGCILESNNAVLSKSIQSTGQRDNIKGSVVSYYLQEYENRILECVYLYCVDHGYISDSTCSLCFDGLMILKDKFKVELLQELHNEVLQKTGFDLTFIDKPMTDYYTDDQLKNSQIIKSTDDTYNTLKIEFEENNFKILHPFAFATIINQELILRSHKIFTQVYENLLIDDEKPFISKWLKDPSNRTYDKIDFLPCQQAPPNVYNTFKGFAGEKAPYYNVNINDSLLMKHIKKIISNNNEDVFKYFINFLANLVQHPHKKSNTALIIKSIQGTGKDTIMNWFGNNILGKEYYFNDDSVDLIFGKFTSCIENKILCVLNEASGKDTFTINEKIKNAITRDINIIEHKGLTPYSNTNNVGYVFLTNNDNPIKVSNDDRRLAGFECSHENANNKVYFNALYDEIASKKYDRAFYDYFMSIDLNNFNFIDQRPATIFYNNMKELNIPILVRFFESIIDKNLYKKEIIYTSSDLFNKFNDFLKENNFKIEYTSTKFGIDIKNYDGVTKQKTRTHTNIIFNIELLKTHLIKKYKVEFVEFIDEQEEKEIIKPKVVKVQEIKHNKSPEIDPLDVIYPDPVMATYTPSEECGYASSSDSDDDAYGENWISSKGIPFV